MTKTLATIAQALKTDYNLELQISYYPREGFTGRCVRHTNPLAFEDCDEEIEVECSNIGGVLEQLAREMLEKYLSNEIPTENNNVLPNDRP